MGLLLFLLLWQQGMAMQLEAGEAFDAVAFDDSAERMRKEAGAPGLAVAVLQAGQVVHATGYGIAGPDGQLVTPGTAFQIGSITKSITALVVLQMASEGKLDLDDPLVRHVPEFRTADKSRSDRITIDHLVTHHSGLTTLAGNSLEADDGSTGPAAAIEALADVRLFAEPGSAFQYSNANYVLLSHLIEVLDETSFEQILQARIFGPLEMTKSFVQAPPSDGVASATGYRLWFGVPQPWQARESGVPDRRMIGAGGVWASVLDLARYVEAVRTGDPRIVPAEADRLFAIKPFYEPWGYAYGWYANSADGPPIFEHSGFTPGFLSLATIVPAQEKVVVVLTNMSGLAHGELPRAVTNAALGWDPVPAGSPLSAKIAIWSAVTAPFGLLLLLFKSLQRMRQGSQPMRSGTRALKLVAAVALVIGVIGVYWGFQVVLSVSFRTGYDFFPDLTVTTVAAMILALLLALVLLAEAFRGGRLK